MQKTDVSWLFRSNRKQAKLPPSATATRPLNTYKSVGELRGIKIGR